VQFKFALASAKQLDTVKRRERRMSQPNPFFTIKKDKGLPQVGTPVKLGNCAELVRLAELVELVVLVAVAFADGVLLLALDDVDADVKDDASCDHTIDAKN
jgi:hypothetical protein